MDALLFTPLVIPAFLLMYLWVEQSVLNSVGWYDDPQWLDGWYVDKARYEQEEPFFEPDDTTILEAIAEKRKWLESLWRQYIADNMSK